MYIYQVGYFGYDEGQIKAPVVLEHSTEYSDKEIYDILVRIREDFAYADRDTVIKELCDKYGFKVKIAKEINMIYFSA